MKTNKPGTVTQQPLFGCASCYDDVSYPADHLHVYNGECWCENCWEYATHEIADGRDWSKLEPFKPALQVECERWKRGSEIRDEQNRDLHSFIMELKAECEELRTALAESRANDLTAMGYLNQIRQLVGGDDFPDMVRRCEKLRKVADQYRRLIELGEDFQWENIIRVDISDFPSRAAAIDAAMQGDQP